MHSARPNHMFWSKIRTLAVPVVVVAVTVSLGMLFHIRGERVVEVQLKERMLNVVSVAALQFDGDQIERIRDASDMDGPDFATVVEQLKNIRHVSPRVRFAYIMRKTENPLVLSFVADADALSSADDLDVDNSNVVEDDEQPGFTGDPYEIEEDSVMRDQAFLSATVDPEITVDQWGNLISAYAPITDSDGEVVAILGMDIQADEFLKVTQNTFSIMAVVLVGLVGLFLAAYVMFIMRARHLESLEQVEQERTTLLDLATHQLGMPLATFRWWLEILRERDNGKFCKKDGVCDQLQMGIDRMDSIINALHEVSALQDNLQKSSDSTSNIGVVAKKVSAELAQSLRSRKQHLVLKVDPNLKNVPIDEKLFVGMLREVVENASFYSPNNSTIVLRARHIMTGLEIAVEDKGHGIPKQDLPHIFEKFRRASNASKYKPAGNGLGLYIVRSIVKKMRGRVRIESILNKGTTVFIQLPIV